MWVLLVPARVLARESTQRVNPCRSLQRLPELYRFLLKKCTFVQNHLIIERKRCLLLNHRPYQMQALSDIKDVKHDSVYDQTLPNIG